jgi:hypothetical protein
MLEAKIERKKKTPLVKRKNVFKPKIPSQDLSLKLNELEYAVVHLEDVGEFDACEQSQERIMRAMFYMELNEKDTLPWKTANDEWVELSYEQFKSIFNMATENQFDIWRKNDNN